MHIMLINKNTQPSFQTLPLLQALSLGLVLLQSPQAFADYKGENPMQESRESAAAMLKELGGKLQAALKDGGPVKALGVCNIEAPDIAMRISDEEKITIRRISHKPRNATLGVPNDWQTKALKLFEEALARGDKPADIEFVEAVKAGSGSRMELRFAKPILMQPQCTACHGTPEQISPEVKAKLDELYPNDKAVGFKPGELRGAIVVSRFIGYNNN
jgi:hypothetical protein